MEPAVEIEGLYQHLEGRCVLANVSLRLQTGEQLLVLGPNGAGKTLLMRLVLGLDQPSAGRLRVLGRDLARLGTRDMRALRREVGAVLQGGSLLASRPLIENLLLPLRRAPMTRAEMARAARLVITRLRLDGLEGLAPRALSLGQRRRAELARALITRPRLLVWDGFSDGLDPPSLREIMDLLGELGHNGNLTLIAADNARAGAADAIDRLAVIDRGRVLFDGSSAGLAAAIPARLDLRYVLEGTP